MRSSLITISLSAFALCIQNLATAEASSNLARFDGVRYTHRSPEAKDALTLFTKSRGEGFGGRCNKLSVN